jgi:hypothetical protein
MKKLIVLAALALIATAGFSQTTATATGGAKAEVAAPAFDTQNFDFGKVKQGVPATHEFVFTNKSKVPMVITNVSASCGCTTPDWTKDPIPPNGQGFVKATYNAAAVGTFDKSVTVMANVENGVVVLRIHGEVVAAQQ